MCVTCDLKGKPCPNCVSKWGIYCDACIIMEVNA